MWSGWHRIPCFQESWRLANTRVDACGEFHFPFSTHGLVQPQLPIHLLIHFPQPQIYDRSLQSMDVGQLSPVECIVQRCDECTRKRASPRNATPLSNTVPLSLVRRSYRIPQRPVRCWAPRHGTYFSWTIGLGGDYGIDIVDWIHFYKKVYHCSTHDFGNEYYRNQECKILEPHCSCGSVTEITAPRLGNTF